MQQDDMNVVKGLFYFVISLFDERGINKCFMLKWLHLLSLYLNVSLFINPNKFIWKSPIKQTRKSTKKRFHKSYKISKIKGLKTKEKKKVLPKPDKQRCSLALHFVYLKCYPVTLFILKVDNWLKQLRRIFEFVKV